MLTTCPECQTTFRVAHDQLESRRGLVRCGFCRAVFNAYDTLLPEFDTPASVPTDASELDVVQAAPPEVSGHGAGFSFESVPVPESVAEVAEPSIPEVASETVALNGPEPSVEPESEPESAEPELETATSDTDTAIESAMDRVVDPFNTLGGSIPRLSAYEAVMREDSGEPRLLLSVLPMPETPDSILLSELPTRSQIEPELPFWKKAVFGFLSLVLVLVLIAQLAYFLRGPIVEAQPELRPFFEQACQSVGCEVPISQQLDALRVESSSLETDPEQPSRAKLKVSFSNRSSTVQAWPCFILRLSSLQGSPLAQRAFWPKDYLPKTKSEQAGMAPMSELEFQLDLDLGGLSASGYEIKPQYP